MQANRYLKLAERLADNPDDETVLQPSIAALPKLDRPLLEALAKASDAAGDHRPRNGWAIARIANLAANQNSADLWLQSLSAWYLARAANRWVRPALVTPALHQARSGFKKLNEPAWLAACDWQATELSWIRGDVLPSIQTLKNATAVLQETNLQDFAIQSRLSYASTRLYANEVSEAQVDLALCREYFTLNQDEFGLAQCVFLDAIILRTQNQWEKARNRLESAIQEFSRLEKLPFLARALYQTGVLLLFTSTDIPQTMSYLERADELFKQCDLELWHGICQNYLGLTALQDGQLSQSERCFETATTVFQHYHTPSLLANNYTSSGLLHLAKGEPQKSLIEFQNSHKLHKRIGEYRNASVASVNLGKTYLSMERYQEAIDTLERAKETVKSFNHPMVLADCDLNIATAWIALHNYPQALEYLDLVETAYIACEQNASLTTVSNLKARVYFEMDDPQTALTHLKRSLERSNTFHLHAQAALAHRLIGQLLLRSGELASSLTHLQTALHDFAEMGMSLEEAYCRLSVGDYYEATGKLDEAAACYDITVNQSHETFNEVNWRAYIGLARLAEKRGNDREALRNYQSAIAALNNIRSNFWQAELAGSYASQPSEVFSNAIRLAAKLDSAADLLQFIETDKAGSFSNGLSRPARRHKNIHSNELEALKSEINWLQDQMRATTQSQIGLKSALQIRQFRQQLSEKSREYARLNATLQRKANAGQHNLASETPTLTALQTACSKRIGEHWAAVDYYLHEDELFILLLTPRQVLCLRDKLSPRASLALESCLHSQQAGQAPEASDLNVLGNLLLPAEIRDVLDPDTYLLLSPHSRLHGLPWNALLIGNTAQPLVMLALPVIVPSLRSAVELWKPSSPSQAESRETGLVIGVSEFAGRYPALPSVETELANFAPILAKEGKVLKNEEATWQALVEIAHSSHKKGLAHFRFLHLASHFFSDSASGALSGLAFWKETVYQDQLRALAPLPELVTLSGCSSIFSRTFAGDEHVSLATTCLAAGARSVIGSYWPVPDKTAAEFMQAFYHSYFSGSSPAIALAEAQREAIRSGKEIVSWGGYCCIGKG